MPKRRLGIATILLLLLLTLSAQWGVSAVRAAGGSLRFGPSTKQLWDSRNSPFGNNATFADINDDGFPDLISAFNVKEIRIQLARPQGGFENPRVLFTQPISGQGAQLAVADFDGDGLPDLCHGGRTSTTDPLAPYQVTFFKNMGAGVFEHRATFLYGAPIGSLPHGIADFNNDGRIDLLGLNGTQNVPVLQNEGDWQFRLSFHPAPGAIGGLLAFADLDSDGNPDFYTLASHPDELSIFYGDGDGFVKGFASPYEAHALDTASITDSDRSGGADLVLPRVGEALSVRRYLQTDDRNYVLREDPVDINRLRQTVAGDLDLDGWPDLVTLSWDVDFKNDSTHDDDEYFTSLDVLRSNEGTGFTRTRLFTKLWGPALNRAFEAGVTLIDTNRDGLLEIVILGYDGAGHFGSPGPGPSYNFIEVYPNTTTVQRDFPTAPMAHWKADRDALDSADENINGVVLGEVAHAQSVLDKGFSFTGAGGVVRLPDHPRINGKHSYTVAGWVRAAKFPTSRNTPAVVYMRGDDRTAMAPISLRLETDGRLWYRINSHTVKDGVSVPFLLHRWTHVAASYDSLMHRMRLFIDGRLVIDHSTAVLPVVDLKLFKRPGSAIGNHPGAPDGPQYWPFFGLIDDVRFYAKPLSENEVKTLFEMAPPQSPAAPDGLKITPLSPASLRVTWRDQSFNESQFEVERQTADLTFVRRAVVPGDVTTFDDTSLAPDTTYTYRVRAVNGNGASPYSATAAGRTLIEPWPAPSNLDVSSFNSRAVNLFWDDNTNDETGFTVERSLNGTAFSPLRALPANAVTYVDTAVLPVTRYWYRVRGVRGALLSNYTNTVNHTTLPNPPAAPDQLTVEVRPEGVVVLRWSDMSDNETKFRLQMRPNGGDWAEIAQLNANIVTWTATGLEPNRAYGFRIQSQNSGGFSDFTSIVNALTLPIPVTNVAVTVPAAPAGRTQLEVRWSDPNFAPAKARLTRAKAGVVEKETVLAAGVRLFKDTGLAPNTAYRYTIYAQNASGEAAGVSKDGKTLAEPPPPPNAPDSLVATALSPTSAKLEWRDNSADEAGFKIERATGNAAFAQVAAVAANVLTWTDTRLTKSTTYRYRLRSYRGADHSGYSGEATVTTPTPPPPPPVAPSSLTAAARGIDQVELAWTDRSNNETKFHVERAESEGAFVEIAAPAANAQAYADRAIAPATTYRYRVRASNEGGQSAYSNMASVTIERLVRGKLEVPRAIDFGRVKVKTTKTLSLVLKNTSGTERLSVTVGTFSVPFKVVSGGGSSILEPGASRTVQLSFTPKKKKKAYKGTLTLDSSDPSAASIQISATGKGK